MHDEELIGSSTTIACMHAWSRNVPDVPMPSDDASARGQPTTVVHGGRRLLPLPLTEHAPPRTGTR